MLITACVYIYIYINTIRIKRVKGKLACQKFRSVVSTSGLVLIEFSTLLLIANVTYVLLASTTKRDVECSIVKHF